MGIVLKVQKMFQTMTKARKGRWRQKQTSGLLLSIPLVWIRKQSLKIFHELYLVQKQNKWGECWVHFPSLWLLLKSFNAWLSAFSQNACTGSLKNSIIELLFILEPWFLILLSMAAVKALTTCKCTFCQDTKCEQVKVCWHPCEMVQAHCQKQGLDKR